MRKKILSVIVVILVVGVLFGCGSKETNSGASKSELSFTTKDLNGKEVKSEDIFSKNKITMVNVWATFCGPCISEIPALEKISKEYKDKKVGVVGIVGDASDENGNLIDENISQAKYLLKEQNATYKNLIVNSKINTSLEISYYPTTVFVDSNGNIIEDDIIGAKSVGQYREMIEELLDNTNE